MRTYSADIYSKQPEAPIKLFYRSRIFAPVLMLIGLWLLYAASTTILRAKDSLTWPTTRAIIRYSFVERHFHNKSHETYGANVTYDYTVNETAFSGNRVDFGMFNSLGESHNPTDATEIVNRYPKGISVAVYYNPKNPQVSVLEPGIKGEPWISVVIGFIFLVLAFLRQFFSREAVFSPNILSKDATTELNAQGNYNIKEVIEVGPPERDL